MFTFQIRKWISFIIVLVMLFSAVSFSSDYILAETADEPGNGITETEEGLNNGTAEIEEQPEEQLGELPEQEIYERSSFAYILCDLRDFVQDVRVFSLDEYSYTEVSREDGVAAGSTYKFEITFSLPAYLLNNQEYGLVYQLPGQLTAANEAYEMQFYTANYAVAGRYTIDVYGFVSVRFADTQDYYDSYVVFTLEIEAMVSEYETGGYLNFGYGFEVEISSREGLFAEEEDEPLEDIDFEDEYILFGGAFMGIAALSGIDQSDLANFITSATMWDQGGNQVTGGSDAILGDTYTFIITFAEQPTTEGQFVYNSAGTLTYRLPSSLIIQSPVTATPIPLANGNIVGWYTISATGLVEVQFGNFDQYGNPTNGVNFIDVIANATFTLQISAQLNGSQLDFGSGGLIDITPVEPTPMLTVNKTSSYDPITQRINYTVILTALGGQVDNIALTDTPTVTLTGGSSPMIVNNFINDFISGISYQLTTVGQAAVVLPQSSVNETRTHVQSDPGIPASFTTEFLYEADSTTPLVLNPGDFITVTYYIDLQALISDNLAVLAPNTLTDYSFTVGNQAVATSNVPTAQDSTSDLVSRKLFLNKTGWHIRPADGSGNPDIIEWTIVVGDGRSEILNGGNITDTLDTRLTFPPDTNIYITAGDNSFPTPVTRTITADQLPSGVFTATSSTGFTFNVPNAGDPFPAAAGTFWGDVYLITIDFQTVIPPALMPTLGGDAVTFTNTATFDDASTICNLTIFPGGFSIIKRSSGICGHPDSNPLTRPMPLGPNGERYFIDYRIIVNMPDGIYGLPFYLYDTLGMMPAGDYVPNIPVFESVVFSFDDGSPDQTWEQSANPSAGLNPMEYGISMVENTWRMFWGTGATSSANSTWPLNVAATLTIDYRIWIGEGADGGTDWLAELQQSPTTYLQNDIYLITTNEDPWDPGVNLSYAKNVNDYWPIFKTGGAATGNPSVFNYTVTLVGDYSFSPESIGGSPTLLRPGTSPIFTDTFDPRMEFVQGSFYVVAGANTYFAPVADTGITVGSDTFSADLNSLLEFAAAPPAGGWQSGGTAYPNWYVAPAQLVVNYQLRLTDPTPAVGEPPLILNNTARITRDTDACAFESTFSNHYNVNKLAKTVEPTAPGSSIVNVDITINPDGLIDFEPVGWTGLPLDSVIVVDNLTNLMLFIDSVQFQTQTLVNGVWDGVWVDVDPSVVSFDQNTYWSINAISANEVHFVVPNRQPVKILYDAWVTLLPNTPGSIGNTVEIWGLTSGDDAISYTVDGNAIVAGGGMMTLRLFKVDAENNTPLQGAGFSLYVSLLPDYIQPAGTTTARDITVNGNTETFYLVASGVTGSDGLLEFKDLAVINNTFDFLFVLVETQAPVGYILPTEPDNFMFFTVKNNIDPALISSAESLFGTINQITDFMTITNELIRGSITIEKTFDPVGVLTADLYSTLSFTVVGTDANQNVIYRNTVFFSDFVNGSYEFSGLLAGTYTISESGGIVAGYYLPTPEGLTGVVTIPAPTGETAITIPVNNVYIPIVQATTPSLRLHKVFHGLTADELPPNFQLVITGPENTWTFGSADAVSGIFLENIPPGDYIIEELNSLVDGFNLIAVTPTLPYTVTLTAQDTEVTVIINNTYSHIPLPPHSLRINKVFSGLTTAELPQNFQLVITGPENTWTFGLDDAVNGIILTNIPAGDYIIEERNAGVAGFNLAVTPALPYTVTITSQDTQVAVTINNTYSRTEHPTEPSDPHHPYYPSTAFPINPLHPHHPHQPIEPPHTPDGQLFSPIALPGEQPNQPSGQPTEHTHPSGEDSASPQDANQLADDQNQARPNPQTGDNRQMGIILLIGLAFVSFSGVYWIRRIIRSSN